MTGPARGRFVAIVAYFGALGSFFDLWAASAGRNAWIDFVLVGDALPPAGDVPPNVRFVPMTRGELERRVALALDLPGYRLTRPYKLCDLRPAYALVFPDLVEGYERWGHCDLDLVFGQVERWLPADLERYDKVFPFGNLSFYRNDERVNTAFRLPWDGPDWRAVLTDDRGHHFDEERGINRILEQHGFAQYATPVNADIDYRYGRMRLYQEQDPPPQAFYWRDGRTWRARVDRDEQLHLEEYAYTHFQRRPMRRRDFTGPSSAPHGWWIEPDGFSAMPEGEVRPADVRRHNPPQPLLVARTKVRRGLAKGRHLVALRSSRLLGR